MRGYVGGHLGQWRTSDLDELLRELYPRKVLADRELMELTVPAVGGLLEFLDDQGLLVQGLDPLSKLLARLEALRDPFRQAFGDSSRYGLDTSLFGAMMADGVAAFAVDPKLLPPVHASDSLAGETDRRSAESIGLRPGIPVAVGGADTAAALFGAGVTVGEAQTTTGTGG